MANEKMTNKEYITIMNNVMKKILGYDSTMKLSKFMILRLQGLPRGETVANKYHTKQAQYEYETIIMTFKLFANEINNALRTMHFKDAQHKFNTVLSIVDKHLNDTVEIMQKKQKAQTITQKADMHYVSSDRAEYVTKSKAKINKEMEDLW